MAIGWRGHVSLHIRGNTVQNQNKSNFPKSETNKEWSKSRWGKIRNKVSITYLFSPIPLFVPLWPVPTSVTPISISCMPILFFTIDKSEVYYKQNTQTGCSENIARFECKNKILNAEPYPDKRTTAGFNRCKFWSQLFSSGNLSHLYWKLQIKPLQIKVLSNVF